MNSTLLYDAAENKLLLRNVNMKGYKKITTRLRKVGTTWTPNSTMQLFCLRRAEDRHQTYTVIIIKEFSDQLTRQIREF